MKLNTAHLEAIIEQLIERYPNKLPTAKVGDFELGVLVGQQDVIKHLIATLEQVESKK